MDDDERLERRGQGQGPSRPGGCAEGCRGAGRRGEYSFRAGAAGEQARSEGTARTWCRPAECCRRGCRKRYGRFRERRCRFRCCRSQGSGNCLAHGDRRNRKVYHVNTNSAINYYTNPGIDSKYTNSSITNSLLNNYPNINSKNSEINGINFNNYLNNVSQHDYSGNIGLDKNIVKYNNINYKTRKHITTISNSLIPNDIHINGYQSSKNNNNSNIILNNKYINNINNNINGRPKSKIISTNSKTNLSKIKQTYSTRQNFLDSRNKTKKIGIINQFQLLFQMFI